MSSKKSTRSSVTRREFIGGAVAGLAVPYLIPAGAHAVPAAAGTNIRAVPAASGPLSPTVSDMLANIRHGDSAARLNAMRQATLVGTEAVVPLADITGSTDPAAAKAAGEALRRIVHNAGRPGAVAEAKAASTHLQKIVSSDYPREVRADAIRHLGYVGDKDAVPALVQLLREEEVREEARMALECIPDREADAALRSAARSMPDYRPALEQSLKHRATKMKDIGTRR